MAKKTVLAVGIEPALADYAMLPGLTPELIRNYLDAQIGRLRALGYEPEVCLIDLDFQSSNVCDYLDIEPRLQIREISADPDRLDVDAERAPLVVDQPGDALHGGIALEQVHRLTQFLERLHERIVAAKNHLVIEFAIDPAFDEQLDLREVDDHVAAVERVSTHIHLDDRVVAVWMLAHAVVVEEAVPVAEVDALGDEIHGPTVT